ncbi:hypothetical protein ACQ4WQ_07365 [Janthinobacterium sp. GB1R12]|uniref:hypothetical protein n=1 Tax=Janthinobacterium sp. GB1R12 TaxID=3424190 RepID=UPI003F289863
MMTQRILFVPIDHDRRGPSCAPGTAQSGVYLSEATHPYRVQAHAGDAVDFFTPKGVTETMLSRLAATSTDWA